MGSAGEEGGGADFCVDNCQTNRQAMSAVAIKGLGPGDSGPKASEPRGVCRALSCSLSLLFSLSLSFFLDVARGPPREQGAPFKSRQQVAVTIQRCVNENLFSLLPRFFVLRHLHPSSVNERVLLFSFTVKACDSLSLRRYCFAKLLASCPDGTSRGRAPTEKRGRGGDPNEPPDPSRAHFDGALHEYLF